MSLKTVLNHLTILLVFWIITVSRADAVVSAGISSIVDASTDHQMDLGLPLTRCPEDNQ